MLRRCDKANGRLESAIDDGHLGLVSDDELRGVLTGPRVVECHRSLDDLRDEINFRARAVAVLACHRSDSDFRFAELARQLNRPTSRM